MPGAAPAQGMIQFNVLSGKKAGATCVARRFPLRLGRSAGSDLQFDDDGVWERHLSLDFDAVEGIVLNLQPGALATVNGQPAQRAVLRNGDTIEMGGLKIRFWLGPTRQASLRFREWLTWLGIAAVSLAQIALVYWLLP